MTILAIDTSSTVATAAVMRGETLLGELILNNGKTHSQKLMPLVNELFKGLDMDIGEIDLFAASVGPGSFTGLRIGIVTIKAMAYSAGKPVISVPTLDALAVNACSFKGLICPIMDARNKQVYTALYRPDIKVPQRITEYMGITVDELSQLILEQNQEAIFVGDAVGLYEDYFKTRLGELCTIAPSSLRLQRAACVAQVAMERANEGKLESCFDMKPFYLRKSQAEREYERKNAEKQP